MSFTYYLLLLLLSRLFVLLIQKYDIFQMLRNLAHTHTVLKATCIGHF